MVELETLQLIPTIHEPKDGRPDDFAEPTDGDVSVGGLRAGRYGHILRPQETRRSAGGDRTAKSTTTKGDLT